VIITSTKLFHRRWN